MKIVFLTSSAGLGGVERAALDLLAGLREAEPGWGLHLIAPGEGPLVARAAEAGARVEVLEFPRALARLGDAGAGGPAGRGVDRLSLLARACGAAPPAVVYARRLRRLLGRIGADVVHAHGLKTHALGAWARPRGARVVWHVHDYVSPRLLSARLLRASASRADAVVANSQSVAADLGLVLGPRARVRAVLNAVDLGRFAGEGARADLDALSGVGRAAPGTVRVGLVATLSLWKGHRTFLEALALLPAGLPVRAYVVGDAIYQTEGSQHALADLRREAARLGLAGRVGFTGFVEEREAVMRALDVVVHASTEPEPFGLVIAEGMAAGRAVVASRAGGAAELFTPDVDALGHAPGDARALASCIERLVSDETLRERLGRRARETARARFDRARLAAEVAQLYRALQAGREATLLRSCSDSPEGAECNGPGRSPGLKVG